MHNKLFAIYFDLSNPFEAVFSSNKAKHAMEHYFSI